MGTLRSGLRFAVLRLVFVFDDVVRLAVVRFAALRLLLQRPDGFARDAILECPCSPNGMHEGDRRGRNRFQRVEVSEVTNLGQEIVPPVRLVPKHSRTMLSRPRIVLDYAGCDRNAQLHSHHRTQEAARSYGLLVTGYVNLDPFFVLAVVRRWIPMLVRSLKGGQQRHSSRGACKSRCRCWCCCQPPCRREILFRWWADSGRLPCRPRR